MRCSIRAAAWTVTQLGAGASCRIAAGGPQGRALWLGRTLHAAVQFGMHLTLLAGRSAPRGYPVQFLHAPCLSPLTGLAGVPPMCLDSVRVTNTRLAGEHLPWNHFLGTLHVLRVVWSLERCCEKGFEWLEDVSQLPALDAKKGASNITKTRNVPALAVSPMTLDEGQSNCICPALVRSLAYAHESRCSSSCR